VLPVEDYGDLPIAFAGPDRDPVTGLIDPAGLVDVITSTEEAVGRILADDRFPLVLGGDCPVLLGCLSAARRFGDRPQALFVDGHEDAYAPSGSTTGEAADMEVAFALGLADAGWSAELAARLPLLSAGDLAMLGPRDAKLLAREGVASIADRVRVRDGDTVAADPAGEADAALEYLGPREFWFHLDLDALSTDAMPAVDYPQEGGLSWEQVAALARRALVSPAARGWDVTIYNPDLDPAGRSATRIVAFVADALRALARRDRAPG